MPPIRDQEADAESLANLEKLKQFVAKHDRLPRRQEKTSDGFPLGRWVDNLRRRREYHQRKQPELVALLEGLPYWTWFGRIIADRWQDNYRILRDYFRTHDSMPPRSAVHLGARIGDWANNQRKSYKRGELAVSRIRLLSQLPQWKWPTTNDAQWRKMHDSLVQYHEEHGKLPEPAEVYRGEGLGDWVTIQRRKRDSSERADILSAHSWWHW